MDEQELREKIAREIESYDYQFMSRYPLAISDPKFVARDMRGIAAHIARNGISNKKVNIDASNVYWVHYKYSYGEGEGLAEKRGNEYYFFGSEMPDEEKDIVSAIPVRIEIAHSTES